MTRLIPAVQQALTGVVIVVLAMTGVAAVAVVVPADAFAATTTTAPTGDVNPPPGGVSTAVSTLPAEPRPDPTPEAVAPYAPPRVIPTPLPPAGLSISTPDATVSAAPGTTVTTWLVIGNLADTPVTVAIAPAMVVLGNNGLTSFGGGPDPRFAGAITLSQTQSSIPVGGFVRVEVDVAIPATMLPDMYVLGFVATPIEPTTNVRIVNQVGMLINLNVAGPRDRHLTASFIDVPWIMITDHPTLTVRAESVGASALEFTSEDTLSGLGAPTPASTRYDPRLLPAGRYRDLTVAWDTPWGFGIDTVTTTLIYPQTQYSTAQVVATHRVLVIKPFVATITAAVLLLTIVDIALVIAIRGRRTPARPRIRADVREHRPPPR